MTLEGRTAVVTGGGSGIGAAICRRLASDDANVAVLDVNTEAAETIARDLGNGLAVTADVTDSSAVDDAVNRVVSEMGGLDILVNNAGIAGGEELQRIVGRMEQQVAEMQEGQVETALEATVQMTDEQWRRMLAIHLDGTFYASRAALRVMTDQGSGVIINIASICGIEGCTGSPHYSAAKGGILGFTRSLAKEVIQQGIRVNAVAPGYVDTPMVANLSPALLKVQAMQTPLGRLGRPEEIAATVAFLASDEASFFVGETISPNGGYVTT